MIESIGLEGIPSIEWGDDLAGLIVTAAERQGVGLVDGDVIVVTQKVVSKAEGRVVNLGDVKPSSFAKEVAKRQEKDPRHVELILRESRRVVKMKRGILIMETRHGFICANAGVDRSNIEEGNVCLLPIDPDSSAQRIRERIKELTGRNVAVIVTDTWGRPWRLGQVDYAIGVAGMSPFRDYRGEQDSYGYELEVTNIAVADELASAAELVKGKVGNIPVVIIRGYHYQPPSDKRGARALVRPVEEDLFR